MTTSSKPSASKRRAWSALSLAVSLASTGAVARADDLTDLREKTEALQRKVDEIDNAQRKAAPAGGVAAGSSPGSFRLPDSSTSIKFGGYVKFDAVYSDITQGVDAVANQQTVDTAIPVGPNGTPASSKTGQLSLHARQTRLYVGTSTPTGYGAMTTYIEGDFFGADGNESVSNSNGFRIRHAYGTLGNFLAGQYWTNFFDENTYAETVDFGGTVGEIFVRQAQARWTQPYSAGEWSVSLENPESLFAISGSALTAGSATPFRSDRDHYPDTVGRLKWRNDVGTFNAALMARNIRIDSPTADDAKWGGAISFTGIVPIGRDDFRANLNWGNAIGRYQLSGFFPDGYVDATGKVRLAQARSAYAAYRHFWTPELRSSLILGASDTDTPGGGTFDGFNKSARSAHANLIFSPVPRVNLGVELIGERRTVVDGDYGTLRRVQFGAQFFF
ncbi:MAG TPA: DcaP family trimeric outer membrane transporter [Burkholderiales bacterium]|nr:DcaP family trimeric outer membrane transporter [Burkholderiales bacterium]